jgi:hypothetical protein
MPQKKIDTAADRHAVVHVDISSRSTTTPDANALSQLYLRAEELKAQASELLGISGKDALSQIDALIRRPHQTSRRCVAKPLPSQKFDDIEKNAGYPKLTPWRELDIRNEPQNGEKAQETDAARREIARQKIERISVDNQTAQFEAAKAVAAKLKPLIDEYIDHSVQTTIEGQRELCEYVRRLCHANHLAVKCPGTGVATLPFATPRLDRKNASALRVVFRNGRHGTHSDTRLRHVDLLPSVTIAEESHQMLVNRDNGQEISR